MTEFLLVHGMGQGAWTWGKVWGRLTAPVEHPPRLQITRQAGRVATLDLPGHGSDAVGDTAQVRMEECVHAIVRAVEREGLKDVVLVGHDLAGSLIAQAARQLSIPPKRLVMLAGIVPPSQRSMLAVLPTRSRAAYRLLDVMSKISRQDFRLPRYVIGSYLCNGMSPMELVEVMGFFGPLPVKVITSRVPAEEDPASLPGDLCYAEPGPPGASGDTASDGPPASGRGNRDREFLPPGHAQEPSGGSRDSGPLRLISWLRPARTGQEICPVGEDSRLKRPPATAGGQTLQTGRGYPGLEAVVMVVTVAMVFRLFLRFSD